ncbi:Protein of unknown function DUF3592 [Actinobacteria bacterium OK074]|nr:Protein of unknown function DUF3592 [Actinobacteria bacterium OK074]
MRIRVRGRGARWWIPFGAISFGTLFFVIGLILAGVSVSFLTDAERARGTVVDLEWRNSSSSSGYRKGTGSGSHEPSAYPVVEFTAADGTSTTFRDSTGSNPPAYERGERVEVLYRADSPEDARINGFLSLWLLPLVFGGVGLVIAGAGTAVAVVLRRRRS